MERVKIGGREEREREERPNGELYDYKNQGFSYKLIA